MRETVADFKRFLERYKYVLGIAALMVGPALFTLGTAMSYYAAVVKEIREAHRLETVRYRGEIDSERVTNRKMLEETLQQMSKIADRLGVAATKVEDAAATAQDAASTAAKAAAKLPRTPATPLPTEVQP